MNLEKTLTRTKPGERFELEIKITDQPDGFQRLSICGGHWTSERSKAHRFECCFGQNTEEMVRFFPEVEPFLKWHLNDMHAECEHQEKLGWTWKTHPDAKCPECGYLLGHAWTKRELPVEVIEGLSRINK